MPQTNQLIVRTKKYFPIMQFVCFELFFLSNELLIGFSVFFTNFLWLKVFQGFSLNQGLSPSLSRLNTNRLKGFFAKYLNIWVNQLWQSHPFKEFVRCIREIIFLIWCFRCCNSSLSWIDVSINMSEVFCSLQSLRSRNARKKVFREYCQWLLSMII